jgi:flagellar hook-length control protein FliK
LSISAALPMPTNLPAMGSAPSVATTDGNAFASLLQGERTTAETPAAPGTPTTPLAMTSFPFAPQLQTPALADPTAETSTAATTPTDGSVQPALAETLLGDAASALIPDGTVSAALVITTQQPLAAAATSWAGFKTLAASPAPAPAPDADTDVTEAGADTPEAGAQTIGDVAPILKTTDGTVAASAMLATSTAAVDAMPAGVPEGALAATARTSAVARPADMAPDLALASDAADTGAAEAVPANPGGRASGAQTPNQPAAAAAATAQPAAPAADTAAMAKPDFASLLASQPVQTHDAPAQAGGQPGETARPGSMPAALQSAPAATIQVYNRIIERADGRAQRFEVRLDPAELGRVDVRIEIGADRKVHAVLAAHDSAALSDLMRGQRALERALADAGIDLADNGVRFELARDNGGGAAGQQRDNGGRPGHADAWRRFETLTMPATVETATIVQPSWRPQRLDLVA